MSYWLCIWNNLVPTFRGCQFAYHVFLNLVTQSWNHIPLIAWTTKIYIHSKVFHLHKHDQKKIPTKYSSTLPTFKLKYQTGACFLHLVITVFFYYPIIAFKICSCCTVWHFFIWSSTFNVEKYWHKIALIKYIFHR